MRARSSIIRLAGWTHNPARRKARFRCQECCRLIADGSDVVIERRPGGAHGYHAGCFDAAADSPLGGNAAAAVARDRERMAGRVDR